MNKTKTIIIPTRYEEQDIHISFKDKEMFYRFTYLISSGKIRIELKKRDNEAIKMILE